MLRGSLSRPGPGNTLASNLVPIAFCMALAMLASTETRAAAPRTPPPPPPAPAGTPRFFNYVSPQGTGDDAGEPSIGSNWTREQVFSNSMRSIPNGGSTTYFGGFLPYLLKITFNDCQSPALATWEQKPLLTANTPRVFGDPILYTDPTTGRTFVSQLEGLTPLGSTTDFTDNDGDSFLPSEGSGIPSCIDHQTFGGGPFHAGLSGTGLYPNAIYYASQCIADATCSISLDGGVTFAPGVPMFAISDCDGLHGHVKVAPDGTVYVPDKQCAVGTVPLLNGGNASVVVSENNGLTWAIRPVPDGASPGEWDPSVGIAADGTVYLGYQGIDGHARVAVSHDKGLHWAPSVDVGMPSANVFVDTPVGIHNMVFPAMVAGDPDRAALAFYGTETADGPGEDHTGGSNDDPSLFTGVWYLYIATTFDGGKTWATQNVTPGDPIQRGPICGGGDCRNMLDFFGATIDKEGRVLVGWDDGCVGGCVGALPNSNTAKATITRQSGGKRMFAAFDPIEPRLAEAPAVGGRIDNATVQLSWQAPDNGGAAITSYNVYRRAGTTGTFTRIATVSGTTYTDTVNPTIANSYRVTAVNALGEGPYCQDFQPESTPVASPCAAPGVLAVSDLNPDGSDNDSGQNLPPDPSVNIRALSLAEPYAGPNVNQVTFTLQMMPSAGALPPSSQWYILWNRKSLAADGSDRRFVGMKTDAAGAASFVYGDFGPPLPLDGSVPPPNANTPTPLGSADFGSFDLASGVMTIRLADNKLDGTPTGAGNSLADLNVRTYLARPDAGQKSQNNASDITVNGSYTLAGNAACRCAADQPPTAGLSATPTQGKAPLTVRFDGSTSTDRDAGDAVAAYTFDFGDGTDPVTQGTPTISHKYKAASGSSGYFATLTVQDRSCGKKSLNVASVNINVQRGGTALREDSEPLPRAFRIAPLGNPSRGQTAFTLDLVRDDIVSIQVFGADGRRVADLLDAWMPAGTHTLNWGAFDRGGRTVPPGVYLVRARAGGRVALSRVIRVP